MSLGRVLDDVFFTIDYILIQLMRQLSLHLLTFETFSNFVNSICQDVHILKMNIIPLVNKSYVNEVTLNKQTVH